jgi:hypothetical protein
VKSSVVRWLSVRSRNLVARSINLVVALVAVKLYTEKQMVYSLLYSLREFIESYTPKV